MSDLKQKIYSQTVGRRKRAIASVRLIPGKGEITVNNKKVTEYFPANLFTDRLNSPFTILDVDKYAVTAKVRGGGISSQFDALLLGISRSLSELKPEYKKSLRDANLLTRDSRKRQRRMVGMGGKSRRKKQSPKR